MDILDACHAGLSLPFLGTWCSLIGLCLHVSVMIATRDQAQSEGKVLPLPQSSSASFWFVTGAVKGVLLIYLWTILFQHWFIISLGTLTLSC